MLDSLQPHGPQHTRFPCSSLSPGVCSNSCPLQFHELSPARLLCPRDSTGKNTGMGWHSLLQGIFPTQGSNPCLLCLLHWKVDSLPVAPLTVREALTVESSSSSVAQLCLTLWLRGLQHVRLPCPSPTPGAYSNSCPLSQWCHPTLSFSVIPFSSHLQSFPASGSFPMSQFFTSGGQGTGDSDSASVLPMNIQDWFPLGWTGWISLQSKGLSRVFSNTTVQKHQFFGT